MATRTSQGQFWLSSAPETTRRGQVTFNGDGSLTLVTEGGFDDRYDDLADWMPLFVLAEDQDRVNINGSLIADHVKMVGCVVESTSGGAIGRFGTVPQDIRWRCGIAFVGDDYDGDIPSHIKSTTVRISGLNDWVGGFDGVRVVVGAQEGKITWNNIPVSQTAEWTLGQVSVTHQARYGIDHARHHVNEARVTSDTLIHIELDDPQSWDTITDVMESLQCLISIASGKASNVEMVSVVEFDGQRKTVAAHYRPLLHWDTTPTKFPPLLSFDDVGGAEGIATWIAVLQDRRVTRRSLLTDVFLQPTFITDRTGHLLTACEALMRDTGASATGQLNLNTDILQPLIDLAGPGFHNDIGDVGQWIGKVSQIRNHYGIGHVQGNPNAPKLEDVLVVNRQLFVLVTTCLLRECGVSEEVLQKVVQRSQSTWWIDL